MGWRLSGGRYRLPRQLSAWGWPAEIALVSQEASVDQHGGEGGQHQHQCPSRSQPTLASPRMVS